MKSSKTHHHAVMSVPLHTDELEQVERAAAFYGKDVFTFMRDAVLSAAARPRVRLDAIEPVTATW